MIKMNKFAMLMIPAALVVGPSLAMAEGEDAAPAEPAADPSVTTTTTTTMTPDATTTTVETHADADGMGAYTKDSWPQQQDMRPLTLAKGMIAIDVDLGIGLSKDNVGKPITLAPDVWYGVSDKLTVGLTHAEGLCLTGTDNGCVKLYNDVGLRAKFSVQRKANMEIAAHGALNLLSLDPDLIAQLAVGAEIHYTSGKIGVTVDPTIGLGLTQRDAGNKESISLPVYVAFQASPQLSAYLHTGIGGFAGGVGDTVDSSALLDGFGDNWSLPLGVGATFAATPKVDVGAELLFPTITGSKIASDIGTDARGLVVRAQIRI